MVNRWARVAAFGSALLASAMLTAACQSPNATDTTNPATPALLVTPNAQTQAELRQAVQVLSGFASVLLSARDLTQSSQLTIERKHQHDGNGSLLQGRDLEMPQRFELQLQGGQCWLLHRSSGKRHRLLTAQCAAER